MPTGTYVRKSRGTYIKKPVEQRFWNKVDIKGPNECWNWKAGCNKGYGLFKLNGKIVSAHVFAWELANRKSAKGKIIRHTCDNPPCCNPAHLIDGTHQDNRQDCVNKGRQAKGEQNGSAKLTEEQVLEIRELYKTKQYSQRELARMFDVVQNTISRIVTGKGWKCLHCCHIVTP